MCFSKGRGGNTERLLFFEFKIQIFFLSSLLEFNGNIWCFWKTREYLFLNETLNCNMILGLEKWFITIGWYILTLKTWTYVWCFPRFKTYGKHERTFCKIEGTLISAACWHLLLAPWILGAVNGPLFSTHTHKHTHTNTLMPCTHSAVAAQICSS